MVKSATTGDRLSLTIVGTLLKEAQPGEHRHQWKATQKPCLRLSAFLLLQARLLDERESAESKERQERAKREPRESQERAKRAQRVQRVQSREQRVSLSDMPNQDR